MTPDSVRKIVWEKKPALHALVAEQGKKSIKAYFRDSIPAPRSMETARNKELAETFFDIVQPMLGSDIAKRATEHLIKTLFVSTADHHGPICHPFFVNANIVQGVVHQEESASNPAPVIVLSCGGVSLNNSSFPRGLLVHDKAREYHIPLISLRYRHMPVFALGPYGMSNANMAEKKLNTAIGEAGEKIVEIYKHNDILSRTRYSKQITITNNRLWKMMPGQENIDLIYVEQEDVVVKLLLRHHMQAKTLLHKMLFEPDATELFKKHFDGVTGAFHKETHHGTFLFWGIRNGIRMRFHHENHALVSDDGTIRIPLSPAAISAALDKRELMPSMALTFIVLMFYYGITCAGGFSQINYLPTMQRAYQAILRELGEQAEADAVGAMRGDIFRGEFVLGTIARHSESGMAHSVHATSIDYILYQNEATATTMRALVDTLTLGDAIDAMMPAFYKIVTGTKTPHAGYAKIKPILEIKS